jgi:hypothetical protein
LVQPQRDAFAIEHFVVDPTLAQDRELLVGRVATLRAAEDRASLLDHLGADDDHAWIVSLCAQAIVGREQQAAERDEVEQRFS